MSTLKSRVRDGLSRLSPNLVGGVLAARGRRHAQRVEIREGLAEMSEQLVAQFGSSVLDGPFRGLRLPDVMRRRHIGPFLAGSYESALLPFLEESRSHLYDTVVDVGSSFGYYAVGLARMHPSARVVAYDTDSWARRTTRETAALNECSNVEVRAACSPSELTLVLDGLCLVVSDCEGYEETLFSSIPSKRFATSELLIELHPPGDRGVADRLRQHFRETHTAETVDHLPAAERDGLSLAALTEWRDPSQQWLILRPLDENPT